MGSLIEENKTTQKRSGNGNLYHEFDEELHVPESDNASYKLIKLENDLVVLLISDTECLRSAAAMNVQVGHLEDPDNLPGCAHFCEHLLLRGSKKFPAENSLHRILADNAGSYDAHTSTSNTCYEFQIAHDSFETALEIFADIFVQPRFNSDSVKREVRAVNAEHCLNLDSDKWRHYQLFKSLSAPDHPFTKFGTGNWETLWELPKAQSRDSREELLSWYDQKYSSNIMRLVISSPLDMVVLLDCATVLFQTVPNRGRKAIRYSDPVWNHDQQSLILRMKSRRDENQLIVSWLLPDLLHDGKESHYLVVLCNLLGHEGTGSIMSLLRKHGLCSSLFAGPLAGGPGFNFLQLTLVLSDKGKQDWKFVVSTIWTYVSMLGTSESPLAFFRELQEASIASSVANIKKGSPMKKCSRMAARLQVDGISLANCLRNDLHQKWDAECFKNLLSFMNLENCRISLWSRAFADQAFTEVEKIYKTPYHVVKLQTVDFAHSKQAESKEIHLPERNIFLFSGQKLAKSGTVASEHERVKVELQTPSSIVWTMQTESSTCCIHIALRSNSILQSVENLVCANILASILNDAISEDIYPALLAGYQCRILLNESCEGLTMDIKGPWNGILILARVVLDKICRIIEQVTVIADAKLLEHKIITEREIVNSDICSPVIKSWMLFRVVFSEVSFSIDDLKQAVPMLGKERWTAFLYDFAQSCSMETLMPSSELLQFDHSSLRTIFKGIAATGMNAPHRREALHIELGNRQIRSVDQRNSSTGIVYLLELGKSSDLMIRAFAEILATLIHEPVCTQLRNEEQLGYVIEASCVRNLDILLLRISIESPMYPGVYLDRRIEAFLEYFVQELFNMSPQTFASRRETIAASLQMKIKLGGTEYLWSRRLDGELTWNTMEDVEAIRGFKLEQFSCMFTAATSSVTRRKVSVIIDPPSNARFQRIFVLSFIILTYHILLFWISRFVLNKSWAVVIEWKDIIGYRKHVKNKKLSEQPSGDE